MRMYPAAYTISFVFLPVMALQQVGVLKQQLHSVLEGTRQLEAGVIACEGDRRPYVSRALVLIGFSI